MGKKNRQATLAVDDTLHRDYVQRLRNALIGPDRKDRDVTMDVKPFMCYKRNGLDLAIDFATKLTPSHLARWALDLCKRNMQETYDKSGYMWDDDDKREELTEHGGAGRFLIVRHANKPEGKSAPPAVGFVQFRFSLQGEAVGCLGGEPCVYVMDIQLEPEVRRKGLGKHLVRTLEMVARKQRMMHLMFPVTVADEGAAAFLLEGMKGFARDDLSAVVSMDGSDAAKLIADDGTFYVISKPLEAPRQAAPSETQASTPGKKAPPAPSDGELSAAGTPEKEGGGGGGGFEEKLEDFKASVEAYGKGGKPGFGAPQGGEGVAQPAAPAFDPTFGASAAAAPAPAGSAVSRLATELKAFGAVSEETGGDAVTMLNELIALFKLKNGRDPTEQETEKWVQTLRSAVDAGGVIDEEDGESEEDEEEDDEEEEEEEA